MDRDGIDNAYNNTFLVQGGGDRFMVSACGFHNDLCVISKRQYEVCQPFQSDLIVIEFGWLLHDLPKWPENSHRALAFGNINPYCVHVLLPL